MLKNLSTISNSITQVIVSLCGITQSVDNLVDSVNSATHAISRHALELDKDAEFECEKNAATRAKLIAEYSAELEKI